MGIRFLGYQVTHIPCDWGKILRCYLMLLCIGRIVLHMCASLTCQSCKQASSSPTSISAFTPLQFALPQHPGCMLNCLTTDMPIYAVTFRLAVACRDDPTWFVFVNTSNMDIWGSYMCLDVFLGFRRCQNHPNTPPFDFWSLNFLIWQPVRDCWGRLRDICLWLSWGPRKLKISS
jgi:hypothetical protein